MQFTTVIKIQNGGHQTGGVWRSAGKKPGRYPLSDDTKTEGKESDGVSP